MTNPETGWIIERRGRSDLFVDEVLALVDRRTVAAAAFITILTARR